MVSSPAQSPLPISGDRITGLNPPAGSVSVVPALRRPCAPERTAVHDLPIGGTALSMVFESVDDVLKAAAPLGRADGDRFVPAAADPDNGLIDRLAHTAAFGRTPEAKGTARWVLRSVAE